MDERGPAMGEAVGPLAVEILAAASAAARAEEGMLALTMGGSAVLAALDPYSDLDLVVVCSDAEHQRLLASAPTFAAALGPLTACFTGQHVGEPCLLICLYGPPALHVDLKLVALRDVACRVEDGVVLWEREPGQLHAAQAGTAAAWPAPDQQWIEDRFWIWIHYAAAKVGRGELLEAVDALATLRSQALGPLLAVEVGRRPQGVRRLEEYASAPQLELLVRSIGGPSACACVDGLRAAVALYRELRAGDDGVQHREAAEALATAYLDEVSAAVDA